MNSLFDIIVNFDVNLFNFERPKVLWLLLLAVVFILLEYFPSRRNVDNKRLLKKFIDSHLIKYLAKPVNVKANFSKTIYFTICYVLIVLAIANPRWDYRSEEIFQPNVNVVLLLDVSRSMNAQDERPSRLERAKQEIEDLLNSKVKARYGLIAFADNAHIITPITDDKNAFKYFLSAIDESIFTENASRVDKGIAAAMRMLSTYKDGSNYIIILSDGGFEVRQSYSELKSSTKDVGVIGLGFGSDVGAPIPDGIGSWIKDERGTMITTKLEKQEFLKLVEQNDFIKATYLDDDTEMLTKLIDQTSSSGSTSVKTDRVWNDRFYIPLALAMLMFLFKFRKGLSFPLILLCLLPYNSYAADTKPQAQNSGFSWPRIKQELAESFSFKEYFLSPDQKAEENFNSKNYTQAADGFESDYNKGVALYKAGNLKDAEDLFSKNPNEASNLYNAGNSQIFSQEIEKAITSYEAALKVDPSHEKAKHNLEIAKKLLEQKKQQEEQQKQQQQKQEEEQKKNKNSKDKNKKNNKDKQQQESNSKQGEADKPEQQPNNANQDPQQSGQQGENKDDKKPEDKKEEEKKNNTGKDQKDSEGAQDKSDQPTTGGQQNKNEGKKQNRTSLDINAEELMNRLKNDPSDLLKRRLLMDRRNNNNDDGSSNGGNRPW
jgi:Ca-activated chloride channel family protein